MLKNLKSLFVIEGEEPPERDSAEVVNRAVPPGDPGSRSQPAGPQGSKGGGSEAVGMAGPAAVDEKMIDSLLRAIDAANLDGFDYLEFKRAVKALQKFSMDEATQYRSAYTTASTIGVTLPELVSSAQHYLHVLDAERDKFQASFQAEYDRKITQSETEVKRLRQEMADKASEIERLQREIELRNERVNELERVTEAGRARVIRTRDAFGASYAHVRNLIAGDIDRMKRYLQ